ncbi:MAG: zf-HC2 domain-containing protein [Ktedonobacteraceae bacterium]|nr:zf-HC2 domain-containing protein [Ktedonobacteraceae bacterium]
MTQHDRHATTEQLSAFLDGQLSTQELPQIEAHLKTCKQCQLQLAGLRQAVTLLHALPQPQLPRSFVLSEEMLAGATGNTARPGEAPAGASEEVEAHTEAHAEERITVLQPRSAPSPSPSRKRQSQKGTWSSPLRNTMRVISTLAAVLGIVLLLSGLLSTQKAALTTMSAPSATNGTAATPGVAPKAQPAASSEQATATATAQTQNTYGTAQADKAPAARSTGIAKLPIFPVFLNPVTAAGRVFWGICLLIASLIGALLLRQQRKKLEQAP